eukprot:scaffold14576_cov132-Isochrysis_galbana.AAC.1
MGLSHSSGSGSPRRPSVSSSGSLPSLFSPSRSADLHRRARLREAPPQPPPPPPPPHSLPPPLPPPPHSLPPPPPYCESAKEVRIAAESHSVPLYLMGTRWGVRSGGGG